MLLGVQFLLSFSVSPWFLVFNRTALLPALLNFVEWQDSLTLLTWCYHCSDSEGVFHGHFGLYFCYHTNYRIHAMENIWNSNLCNWGKKLGATIYLRTEFLQSCAHFGYLGFYYPSLWQVPLCQRHCRSRAGCRTEYQIVVPTKQHHLKWSLEVSHLKHTEQMTAWAFLRNVGLKLLCFIPKLCFAFCNQWTEMSFSLLQVVVNRINVPKVHVGTFLVLAAASFVCPTGHFARLPIAFKLFSFATGINFWARGISLDKYKAILHKEYVSVHSSSFQGLDRGVI